MDMITVDDPDIMNCLMKMCSVECVLLIADKREANHVMANNAPQNIKSVSRGCGQNVGQA